MAVLEGHGSSFYNFEWSFFVLAIFVAAGLQWTIRRGSNAVAVSQDFKRFQWQWLAVYYVVMFADWLQGPYVYALYESYGFKKEEIAYLFVAGFGSSAVFGTFVGSLADKYGRRRLSIAFGIFYSTACLIKTSQKFELLLIGRLLSGIATSLLFSVFEAWMVSEHMARGYDGSWLGDTFSIAIFGNGIAAIFAGVVASKASIAYGYIAPFMISMVFLVCSALIVSLNWNENFGDSKMEIFNVFSGGVSAIQKDVRVLLLGSMQSLFEGSMYVFVFMWTPLLSETVMEFHDSSLGLHGLTFASFMVSIMVGSSVYSLMRDKFTAEVFYTINLSVAAAAFFAVSVSTNGYVVFFCFMLFECCCGIHFTVIGMLRGKYIPEECRSSVMNLFRVPLNLLVVLILIFVDRFESHTVFLICSTWLAAGALAAYRLSKASPALNIPSLTEVDSEQKEKRNGH